MRLTTLRLPRHRPLPTEFTRIHGHAPFADLHFSVRNNQRFLFSCTFLSVLCFIHRIFSVPHLFSAHVSAFGKAPLKIHFDFDRRPFLLQLLQTCVDFRLMCTSTPVTLKVHGCRWANPPTKRKSCFRSLCPRPHVVGSCDWPLQ